MASLDDAAARLRKHDPLLGEALALRLAEAGTRAVDGGFAWKHDPLHLTMGPYPFRRDCAAQYWQTHHVPGARRRRRADHAEPAGAPSAPRAARTSRTIATSRCPAPGHMMQRHQPEALADLLRTLA